MRCFFEDEATAPASADCCDNWPGYSTDRALAPVIEAWLYDRSWSLAFPPALERRFEADTEARRRETFRMTTWICLAIYDSYILIYGLLMPHEFWRFVAAQLGFATPACLLMLGLIQHPRSSVWREGMFCLVGPLGLAALIWAYHPSHALISPNMRYSSIISLLFENVVLGIRFPYAVVSSMAAIILTFVDCQHSDLTGSFRLHVCVNAASVAIFTLIGSYRLEREARRSYLLTLREFLRGNRLGHANRRLQAVSMLDPMTGLANRRAFEVELEVAWAAQQPLGVLMIDVDHFKSFNDHYGHPAGDDCLRRVAGALHAELRLGQDTLARYGGEEFIAIMTSADLASCAALGDRMREAVESLAIPHSACPDLPVVTVSIGVAFMKAPAMGYKADLIEAADTALYRAKRGGRNRIDVVDDDTSDIGEQIF